MTGNNLDDHLRHGVVIENTYGSIVSGNMIEECNGTAIILDRDCYGITVAANTIAHHLGGGVHLLDIPTLDDLPLLGIGVLRFVDQQVVGAAVELDAKSRIVNDIVQVRHAGQFEPVVEDAEHGIAPGTPVMQVRRTALSFHDKPVEYRVSTIHTAVHEYVQTLSRHAERR